MKPTPKLKPREAYVRWVKHAGEGPVANDGHHVIGVNSFEEAAQAAAAAIFREVNDGEEPCVSGDGVHVDVENWQGKHRRFHVTCRFEVAWDANEINVPMSEGA